MIPTINVTPQSPAAGAKYNNMFDDTLSQLQSIRESVVKMKNSSPLIYDAWNCCAAASKLSLSLPDLTEGSKNVFFAKNFTQFLVWSSNSRFPINNDRRKSWVTIDELKSNDYGNKSISLSSLDSEEQDTLRITEHRRRSGRNSTGGISTHSLNEAELVRDFERIVSKRNISTDIPARVPLQKSISTSSIIATEDKTGRHLTDSEDENQGLIRVHSKTQIFDHAEKRRKRGSLFFRKKKEKAKIKNPIFQSQDAYCDYCGVNLKNVSKDHQYDCKAKKSYIPKSFLLSSKKGSENNSGHEIYDNVGVEMSNQLNEELPLLKSEIYSDVPTNANELGADPSLGIAWEEHDSWSPGISKDLLKTLKELQVKRQEHIYEFIMTEKHHCQTLLVIQKIFVESIERHFPSLNICNMFPRLSELILLHSEFLKKLRRKQREKPVVDSISNILLDFFTYENAQQLRLTYGEFCANHRAALEQFKIYMTTHHNFSEWYKHSLTNPLLKKKGIPECILFVTQRLTKYPLLIEPLLKSAKDDVLETDKLQHALHLVKALLVDVDACVAEKELCERQIDIHQRIDPKSFSIYKNKHFRKHDIALETGRRLKFEGLATLMQGRSKMQTVLVVVLSDCLCFFSENSAHNKYTFFTPEHKAGVVPLQKMLIREKAGTESRGIYIISSNPAFPEMYELKVQQPKDKNIWIQSIRQAVLECPAADYIETQDLTTEEKTRLGVNKRDLIEKLRQKDIEQAILLEEKLVLQHHLIRVQNKKINGSFAATSCSDYPTNISTNASTFLLSFGSYKDLVDIETDTSELWKHVQHSIQEIGQLATSVYSASSGVSISVPLLADEKTTESISSSFTLPKRAETFAGFEEKRGTRPFPAKSSTLFIRHSLNPDQDKTVKTGKIMQSNVTHFNSMGAKDLNVEQNDPNVAVLKINHHLHTLLCIISQQITTIQNLQVQLGLYREGSKSTYTHNDQLEELRNLQDKLQEEKIVWLKQKEHQEQELNEIRLQQQKVQDQIKFEQEDIKHQREQLYRKMELLSHQGLLLSANTPLMLNPVMMSTQSEDVVENIDGSTQNFENALINHANTNSSIGNACDRRKWRTSTSVTSTPPVNLISATNAPKVKEKCVKQKIPIKLSSLSSTSIPTSSSKVDKSASFSSPTSSNVVQLFPLKLIDKRASVAAAPQTKSSNSVTSSINLNHSRTGSSPAVFHHPTQSNNNKICSNVNSCSTHSKEKENGSPVNHLGKKNYIATEERTVENVQEDDEIYF